MLADTLFCPGSHPTHVQLGLADPDAPHGDDDQGVTGDEQQIYAEKQEVEDISYMAPLALQLALLLQRGEVVTKVAQVLTDLLQFRQSSCTWQENSNRRDHSLHSLQLLCTCLNQMTKLTLAC